LVKDLFNQEQCDNNVTSPIFSWPCSSWFLPVPSTENSIKEKTLLWCYWRH
jgi:hypothetical protein